MRRGLAWLGGALGLAALSGGFAGGRAARSSAAISDPADELRARLEQARDTPDDRDEFDAAEGQPVTRSEPPRSIEERRRAIHEQAQRALGEMQRLDGE